MKIIPSEPMWRPFEPCIENVRRAHESPDHPSVDMNVCRCGRSQLASVHKDGALYGHAFEYWFTIGCEP